MDGFNNFVSTHSSKLKLIVRKTHGDYQLEDVINEAWLMAQFIREKTGQAIVFYDADYQSLLLSYLYQHLVVYQDKKLRSARSMDAPLSSHMENGFTLADTLSSDEEQCPADALFQQQEAQAQTQQLSTDTSQANAYVVLISHFRNMRDLARYLRISLSYAYYRCATARELKIRQHDFTFSSELAMSHFRAWRKDKYCRPPTQLAFDFECRLPLE